MPTHVAAVFPERRHMKNALNSLFVMEKWNGDKTTDRKEGIRGKGRNKNSTMSHWMWRHACSSTSQYAFQHHPSLVCPAVRSLKLTYTYAHLFSVNPVYRPLTPYFETSCPFYAARLFYGGAELAPRPSQAAVAPHVTLCNWSCSTYIRIHAPYLCVLSSIPNL